MGENKGLSAEEVYGALSDQIEYVDHKLDDAMVKIWSPGGSYTFENLPAPSAQTFRFAYEVTDDFTTDARFVEGAGIDYPAGTTVGVVNRGTDADPVYMYDVSTGAVLVDPAPTQGSTNAVSSGGTYDALAEKIDLSNTPGHVMNDGSIDQTEYEKTGVAETLVKNTVGWSGKNKASSVVVDETATLQYYAPLFIDAELKPSTKYAISFDTTSGFKYYPNENLFVEAMSFTTTNGRNVVVLTTKNSISKTSPDQYKPNNGWIIFKNNINEPDTPTFINVQLEENDHATSYEPYHPTVEQELSNKVSHQLLKDTVGWSGKNKLHLTLEGIKAANSGATWSGNSCTINGVTYTILTDSADNVLEIIVNDSVTSGNRSDLYLFLNNAIDIYNGMILNGTPPDGSDATYYTTIISNDSPYTSYSDEGNGVTIGNYGSGDTGKIYITIRSGFIATNLSFKPMISANGGVFEPYHATVDTVKADKVTNATSGHLAGLDANGNLTDSGVSPTEDVTVEGNPVTFDSPFEQDAKSVVVSVKPIQDLHGLPFPYVGGAYKNKLLMTVDGIKNRNTLGTWSGNVYTIYNGTIEILTDTDENVIGIKVNNTFSDDVSFHIYSTSESCPFNGYILNGSPDLSNVFLRVTDVTQTSSTDYGNGITISVNDTGKWDCYCKLGAGTYSNVIFYPMIRLATESDATFAPYSNICPISGIDDVEIEVSDGESEPTTTTIPLPSTLYDADVDVTNGDADSRKGFVVFDGSEDEDWAKYTSGSASAFAMQVTINNFGGTANSTDELAANYLQTISADVTWGNYDSWISAYGVPNKIVIGIKSITTVEALRAYLAEHPLTVAYKLATPTALSFTPADVELLEGTNVVSTNGEKVAVTYGRSLWQDINDLKTDTEGKLDKSDVADVEGDTASRAYSVNEFMLRADGLYKVTQPIAQNASITASNTTKTTIGAVLTALLNS